MKAMLCTRCVRRVPTKVRIVGMRLRRAAVIQRRRNFFADPIAVAPEVLKFVLEHPGAMNAPIGVPQAMKEPGMALGTMPGVPAEQPTQAFDRLPPLRVERTPLFLANVVHGLVQRFDEMEAVDDERHIRAVVGDRPDVGGTHVATGSGDPGFLPPAQPVVEEAVDGVAALAGADPEDPRAVQVVDEGGEFTALAVGDLIDPERGHTPDGVPVARPRDDPMQQVGQGRGREPQDLSRRRLGHDLTQGAEAPFQAVGDARIDRRPGDLLLHAPVGRALDFLRGIPKHDAEAHHRDVLPPPQLGRLVHDPAAPPTTAS